MYPKKKRFIHKCMLVVRNRTEWVTKVKTSHAGLLHRNAKCVGMAGQSNGESLRGDNDILAQKVGVKL